MKLRNLLAFGALSLPLLMSARPAYPGIMTVTNPDGSTQQIRAFGDEKFHFYTDADGDVIMECDESGKWIKAVRNGRILRNTESDRLTLYKERPADEELMSAQRGPMRMAALDKEGRTMYPTTGLDEVHGLVIMLEYADTPFTIPNARETFDRMLNEEGFSDYGACGSARDYYIDSSNGLFNVHFDVSEIVPLKYGRSHYSQDKKGSNGTRFGEAILEAITYLDDRGTDFSQYDYDNDGLIDNIFFFYSGYGQADTADVTTIWPHQGSYYNYVVRLGLPEIEVDGKMMATYACSSELNGSVPPGGEAPWLTGIGAFCHEYGHVLGLPDLYDTENTGAKTPGRYSVMDQGSYNDYSRCPPRFSSYEQWSCRWLEYTDIEPGQSYSIESMSDTHTPTALRIRMRRPVPGVRYYDEYFVFETRTNTSWDRTFPAEGMFIWHVNYDAWTWTNNQVNTNDRSRVELMYSENGRYAWPPVNQPAYSYPLTDNFIKPWNYNSAFDIYLTNIAFDYENGVSSFDYNMITEVPSISTELSYPADHDDAAREFTLNWKPVEGADSYNVTVLRRLDNGAVRYVDNYNERNVGNVTSVRIGNISSTAWKQEFEAWVRPVVTIPSAAESNHIVFVPSTLSSVDEIDTDNAVICGGEGRVIAPDGADVYTVSGVKVGHEGLAKGLYIVVYGARTEKVVVR